LPLELLMGCEVAAGNSRAKERVAAAGVCAVEFALRTTLKNYLWFAGGVAFAPAKLHACVL
jgi:hypothetical protein